MRTSYTNIAIKIAKIELYEKLLSLTNEDLTCNEADIMYLLSKDLQVHYTFINAAIEKGA